MQVGEMVRADGGGPMMKIVDKSNGHAECVWFDQRGAIHRRTYEMGELSPFWLSIGPRTAWPEITDLPDDFEMPGKPPAKTKRRTASKKPRTSNKIRGRRNAAAA
jgi:uncharacterized protein YodC (DUF2158 family)